MLYIDIFYLLYLQKSENIRHKRFRSEIFSPRVQIIQYNMTTIKRLGFTIEKNIRLGTQRRKRRHTIESDAPIEFTTV